MSFIEIVQRAIDLLPALARFAIMMALILAIPRISRVLRIPTVVGLLLSGVLLGPHMLDVFPREHPVSAFFSELGMLLLMFFAGWEIDLDLFRQKIFRSIVFGVATTSLPLLLGTLVSLWLGYAVLPAIVIGSLLASHTLLALPIVTRLGVQRQDGVLHMVLATSILGPLLVQRFAPAMRTARDNSRPGGAGARDGSSGT